MGSRKYRFWKVGKKEIQVLEGGKQGNVGGGKFKARRLQQ